MWTYLDLTRAVRGVDFLLRQSMGIEEFTTASDCIFRVSLEFADARIALSDETVVEPGEPVLQIHLWNEHLPLMPAAGPNPAWANRLRRKARQSLIMLATYLEQERQLDAVRAVHGAPPFASRIGARQMARIARRFGFDIFDPDCPPELRARFHEIFDSMLLWGLTWAFNPAGLKSKGLLRHRYQLWISRRKLLHLYPAQSELRRKESEALAPGAALQCPLPS
jgi:hypothetical protein